MGHNMAGPFGADEYLEDQKIDLSALSYGVTGTRRQPIKEELARELREAVTAVYGPDYRVEIFSAAQPKGPKGTPGTVGTRRHGTGVAADVWIYHPSGRKLTGDELVPLSQHWLAAKKGSVGFPAKSGQSMHLDLIGGKGPGAVPLGKDEGRLWYYGSPSKSQRTALNAAISKGTTPKYAFAPEVVSKGYIPPANVPQGPPPRPQVMPAMLRTPNSADEVVRDFEDFRPQPYNDVGTLRIGFGSDTVTRRDGTVERVSPGMTVTREDAQRDLERRLPEFEQAIIKEVGTEAWNRLPREAQSAVKSLGYNYGSVHRLPTLGSAIKGGDLRQIADAVEARGADNGGMNAKRRRAEADLIRKGIAPTPAQMPPRMAALRVPGIPARPNVPRPVDRFGTAALLGLPGSAAADKRPRARTASLGPPSPIPIPPTARAKRELVSLLNEPLDVSPFDPFAPLPNSRQNPRPERLQGRPFNPTITMEFERRGSQPRPITPVPQGTAAPVPQRTASLVPQQTIVGREPRPERLEGRPFMQGPALPAMPAPLPRPHTDAIRARSSMAAIPETEAERMFKQSQFGMPPLPRPRPQFPPAPQQLAPRPMPRLVRPQAPLSITIGGGNRQAPTPMPRLNRAPAPMTPVNRLRSQGYSPQAAYEAANQQAQQRAIANSRDPQRASSRASLASRFGFD